MSLAGLRSKSSSPEFPVISDTKPGCRPLNNNMNKFNELTKSILKEEEISFSAEPSKEEVKSRLMHISEQLENLNEVSWVSDSIGESLMHALEAVDTALSSFDQV